MSFNNKACIQKITYLKV